MAKTIAELEKQVNELKQFLAICEAERRTLKEVIATMGASRSAQPAASSLSEHDIELMRSLTSRQHAVCQMVSLGWQNIQIANAFGFTENAAKSHVRYAMLKLGLRNRTQIGFTYALLMEKMPPHEYRAITGLPIDFAKRYKPGDSLPKVLED